MSFMGDLKFCCDNKRKIFTNNALFESLSISPKFILFPYTPRSRRIDRCLTIKNEHTRPRTISFGNDFPPEITIDCLCPVTLQPDECMRLTIFCKTRFLKSQAAKDKPRYSLFVNDSHPNLRIEIPVICQVKDFEVSFPLQIRMPDTSPNVRCYYAFPIHNPGDHAVIFHLWIKENLKSLRFMPCKGSIPSKGCCMIYLEAVSENMCPVLEELTIRFNCDPKKKIKIEAQMVPYMLNVSDVIVRFPLTQLGTRSDKCILLCNESNEIIKFKWCRKESKECSMLEGCQGEWISNQPSDIKKINEYFQIRPKNGFYTPNSSESALVSFTPPETIEDECQRPPFEFQASAYLACSSDQSRRIKVTLIGLAEGPTVEFIQPELDVGTIFVGEQKCLPVIATNTGNITANVGFVGTDENFGGVASSNPQEQLIEPLQSEQFSITYYATTVGRFIEKLFFRVQYGECLTIILKGCAVPLSIEINPKKIEFGDVPLCILQEQNLTIHNSLKVPVVITAKVIDDGEDDPLILSVDEDALEKEIAEDEDDGKCYSSSSFSETQSNTPYAFWAYNSKTECHKIMEKIYQSPNSIHNSIENKCIQQTSDIERLHKFSKCTVPCRTCNLSNNTLESTQHYLSSSDSNSCLCYTSSSSPSETKSKMTLEFNDVIDNTSLIAKSLLTTIKAEKVLEEAEPDIKVIEVAFNEIYNYDYFKQTTLDDEFKKKTWSGLPSNPREIVVKTGPFYFDPQKSVNITVYMVPNRGGPYTHHLELRITPYTKSSDKEGSIEICSKALTMIVPISYNCIVPSLYLSEETIHIETYVNFRQSFFFRVKSLSKIDGFIYFNIIPKNEDVELLLRPRKCYIKAEAWRKIQGRVTVYKAGKTVLNGSISILGAARPTLYRVIINAKPPEIKVEPASIRTTQKVLTSVKTTVDIKNVCPTPANVSLSMEKENYVSVDPQEATLEPGEILYVNLTSYFYDKGSYTNKLIVKLEYSGVTNIPLKYTVEGIPIEFKPNIRNNFDMGTVFASERPYQTDLLIINHGNKPYKLYVHKIKNKAKTEPADCTGFEFVPNVLILNPKETQNAIISVKCTNKANVENEFSVYASHSTSNQKCLDFSFFCTATFVRSLIKWSRDELVFDIRNSELCDTKTISAKVGLINSSELQAEVEISVVGSFTIFDIKRRISADKFKLSLEPEESREFEIFFDMKHEASEKLSSIYEGKIVTKAEKRLQKGLSLVARIIYPAIVVDEEELYYFARKQQFFTFFKIINPGLLAAVYKWNLIEEIELPLSFVYTKKMRQQSNISQYLLSSKSTNLLTSPVDLDEEYFESMSKYVNTNIFEKSSDESEEDTEKSSTTETKSSGNVTKGKGIKSSKKKSSKSEIDVKSNKAKKGSKETKKGSLKESKKPKSITKADSKESKNKKIKSKKSSKKSESTASTKTNSALLTTPSTIIGESTNKIPLDIVTADDIAEELEQFLEDNFRDDCIEDICEPLAPLQSLENICVCPNKYMFLDHYKGLIAPENCKLMNLFFSGHDRDVVHKAKYELEVAAGNSTTVDIVVYNHKATLEISETKFDFGYQPWYKVHQRKIKLANRNNLNFKVAIVENSYLEKYHKLYKGFVTVNPHGLFYMLDEMICELTIKVCMGFSTKFKDSFGVEINNNIPVPVTFIGKAAIPMLTILNVERPFLSAIDRNLEYNTLNKIFLNEVCIIRVPEIPPTKDELCKLHKKLELFGDKEFSLGNLNCPEEAEEEISRDLLHDSFPKSKDLYIGKDGRILKFKDTKFEHRGVVISRLDPEVQDYHVCDYPEEYPSILYIEKMIETNKFLELIKTNEDVDAAFRTIANKHVLENLKVDYDRQCKKIETVQIRLFIVHPLPFNTTTYYLPFEYIRLNEELQFSLELFYHGPGKAVFSVRTSIAIPGLEAEFSGPESAHVVDSAMDIRSNRKFLIYNTKPAIPPGFKYISKTERDIIESKTQNCDECERCSECCEAKVCHAHSYDMDLNKVHNRKQPNRRVVNEYYTKLTQQYRDIKDPYILSELFQEDCESADDTCYVLKIKFFPSKEFYDEGTVFEDFMFIDVHLGPTIPILLRGPIKGDDFIPQRSEDSGLDIQ